MEKNEQNDKIELYGRGFDLLTAALAYVPKKAWEFKPSSTDWSVHEIIVHIGDSESMAALRLRKLIVEPGSTLMGYEEAKWAGALDYQSQDPEDSLQVIKYARLTTYHLLKTLTDEVYTHTVTHPEHNEPYSFDSWLNLYSKHIPDHIVQIKNSVESWKKSK